MEYTEEQQCQIQADTKKFFQLLALFRLREYVIEGESNYGLPDDDILKAQLKEVQERINLLIYRHAGLLKGIIPEKDEEEVTR